MNEQLRRLSDHVRSSSAIAVPIAVAILDAALLVIAAALHAGALLNLDVLVDLALVCLGLAVYAGVSASLLRSTTAGTAGTLSAAALAAAVLVADLAVRYFAALSAALADVATGLLVLGALAVSSRTGFVAIERGATIRGGVGRSAAVILLGMMVLVGFGFAAGLALPSRTRAILAPTYLTAVPHSDYAFTGTIEDVLTHLIEAPILALVSGLAAAFLGRASVRRSRRAARQRRRSGA